MICTDEDIVEMITNIWSSFLEGTVNETDSAEFTVETISGVIHISGDWAGTATVKVGKDLAEDVAAFMFDMQKDELTDEEVADAIGEVTNMLGGSVKSQFSGDVRLSLPTVITGNYQVNNPGTETLNTVYLRIDDKPMVVELVHQAS